MSLSPERRCLLTLITESVIEQPLLRDLEAHGVRGYTVSDARGRGSRGVREGAFAESANIRIEVLCTRAVAEAALAHVRERWYDNYAMVAFLQEVEVLRPAKF